MAAEETYYRRNNGLESPDTRIRPDIQNFYDWLHISQPEDFASYVLNGVQIKLISKDGKVATVQVEQSQYKEYPLIFEINLHNGKIERREDSDHNTNLRRNFANKIMTTIEAQKNS